MTFLEKLYTEEVLAKDIAWKISTKTIAPRADSQEEVGEIFSPH